MVIRAGQLSSAFGSFLLRYDDADNPLVDMPLTYGYYYKPITTYALTGAQADLTMGRVDLRVQLANSSPANRRSVFDSDQYGNWAGGVGYTISRDYGSAHRDFAVPIYTGNTLITSRARRLLGSWPPQPLGVDAEWVRGYWSARGEWQHFRLPYRAIPTYTQKAWYAEVRRVLHPRWYVAMRTGYLGASVGGECRAHEFAAGFRPNRHQLIKIGYQVPQEQGGHIGKTFTVQVVTTLRPFSLARTQ